MLTEQMIRLISTYTIGCVATVRPDGGPAASPKATFLVLDDRTIAFANIRSQGTIDNLCRRPELEVDFNDVFALRGCRVRGRTRYFILDQAGADLRSRFKAEWPGLYELMKGIVVVDVTEAVLLTSPSYDVGATEAELTEQWLRRYASALGFTVTKTASSAAAGVAARGGAD